MLTAETGLVRHETPSDPFRPQVRLVRGRQGDPLAEPMLVSTWEPDGRGDYTWAVVEAVGPDVAGVDPLQYM
jgi:hypothetical protein